MTLPALGHRQLVTIVDKNGAAVPISATLSDASPGATITTAADVAVGVGATVPLPALPTNLRRFTVQVTSGDELTIVRVREVGAGAGRGIVLSLYGSRVYGGLDGAVAALEVQHVAGAAATVCIQYERD